MTWAVRHPRTVMLLVSVLTLLAAVQLPHLQIAISPQSLIIEGDPDQAFYQDALEEFGSDQVTIVFIQDKQLFEDERLTSIRRAAQALDELPFVVRSQSLFNVPQLQVHGDLITTDSYLSYPPGTPRETQDFLTEALSNPFIRHNLLSDDGSAIAINLYIDKATSTHDPEHDEAIANAVEGIIEPLRSEVDTVFQIGLPQIRTDLAQAVSRQQPQLIASAFALLLLLLLLVFRRFTAALTPFLTASISVIWLLGALAFLGIPLNVLSIIVPVLMIIIGSTEDVHLLAEYYRNTTLGLCRLRAIRKMNQRMGLAIGLTFLTTYLGFLAVGANPISLVRHFGLVASSGLAINFLLTAVLVPILLLFLGENRPSREKSRLLLLYERISLGITRLILRFRRTLLFATTLVALGCLFAAGSLQINNSILNYLPQNSPLHERIEQLRNKISGLYTLQVVLDGHIDGAFEQVHLLEEIHEIQDYLERSPHFDHSVSFADYLAVLNSAVNDTGEPELPEEDDVVETLLLFVGPNYVEKYLSTDHSRASIMVRHSLADSMDLARALQELEHYLARHIDPDLHVTITGESVLNDNAVDYLVLGQLRSLGLIMLAILGIISILFLTLKAGLIAAGVILFPVTILFGVMSLAGFPLDAATSMIAAISVGVGIDHFVHFMVRYHHYLRHGLARIDAVTRTVADEAGAIGTATLALASGFALLMLSDFPPIHDFGLLSAMSMFTTFLATFVLAPVLLSYIPLTTLWDLLGTHLRHELALACPLFQHMHGLQIRHVILMGRLSHYHSDQTIMHAGETGDSLFILLRGKITIESSGGNGGSAIKIAQPGEVFGLAAPLCGLPRVATAKAIGRVEVLALNWSQLQRIARWYPRTAYLLFLNLSILMSCRYNERRPDLHPPHMLTPTNQWLSGNRRVCYNHNTDKHH